MRINKRIDMCLSSRIKTFPDKSGQNDRLVWLNKHMLCISGPNGIPNASGLRTNSHPASNESDLFGLSKHSLLGVLGCLSPLFLLFSPFSLPPLSPSPLPCSSLLPSLSTFSLPYTPLLSPFPFSLQMQLCPSVLHLVT